MLAVKGIYDNGQIKWTEPFERVEIKESMQVVVLFMDEALSNSQEENIIPPESMAMMKITDETAFVQDVINSKEEDCWNDL
ncbi:MAG: hypothetical protein KAI83_03530 [Thiomargarita sp.]|nr:hypothetical protein [Thiomargarita sp.]